MEAARHHMAAGGPAGRAASPNRWDRHDEINYPNGDWWGLLRVLKGLLRGPFLQRWSSRTRGPHTPNPAHPPQELHARSMRAPCRRKRNAYVGTKTRLNLPTYLPTYLPNPT